MTTWQPDYQRRDHEVVDYESWTPDGVEISLRGPAPDLTSDFFTCIGSAHTFGCFVARPYPVVLAELLGVPALNLGLGSAGPQFFSARPELVALANRSAFVVLQFMAARQASNSLFESIDGTEHLRVRRGG